MLLGQMWLKRPDDPDYLALKAFRHKTPLVLDIGANGGQSAAAFSFLLPGWQICSFEPNPALWSELEFLGRRLGARFSLRKQGLGDRPDSFTLHIPTLGALPLTTRASLDRAAALEHCAALEQQYGQPLSLLEQRVEVITLDSLTLAPGIIKIDVEGFELAVLEGMRATLASHRPVVLLESNLRNGECQALLAALDYRFGHYDGASGRLQAGAGSARNWFAIPVEDCAAAGL